MSSIDEDEIIRLQVAEEAVRIVRQFNSTKGKEERQKKIIDLCTDIAGILDAKRRLENLVEKQNSELEELRKQNKTAQNTTTVEAQETNRLVPYTPSSGRGSELPHSPSSGRDSQVPSTVSSGRGTAVCDKGTHPAYVWPEKTSTCTRSTSPVLVSSLSSMDSLDGSRESLTNQGEKMNRDTVDSGLRYEGGNDRSSSGKRIADNDEEHEDKSIEDSWVGQENKTNKKVDKLKNETKENNKKNPQRSHGKNNTSSKCRQSSKPSDHGETRPKSQEKAISLPPRHSSPRKGAAEKKLYKAKEKTYKTLWKSDQINLFDHGNSGAKQRKNTDVNNQATNKNSAGSLKISRKPKNAPKAGFVKNTVDQRQGELWSTGDQSEEDEEITREAKPELTAEYWDIHKLIRYLKIGNPTATVISLCALRDLSLDQESNQLAILDLGGINILLNLLRTGHWRCLIGSLKILRLITTSRHIKREIYRLGGIQQLQQCLHHYLKEIQSLAAETLSHVVTFHLAYSAVRRCGVIEQLVNLLQPSNKKHSHISSKAADDFQLTRNTCFALWSCSKNPKNIQAIRAAGAVPILTSLLVSGNDDVVLPAMGIVQECADQTEFREDIRREGMVKGIVEHLRKGGIPLQTVCANALFKCAEDDLTQEIISRNGGLELLVKIMASRSLQHKELLAAAIGALWKCALNKNNVKRLQHLGAVKTLIFLLKNTNQSHEVLANVLGAMHEFAQSKQTLLSLKEEGVIPVVVKLLTSTEIVVLINATRLLAVFGKEASCRSVVLRTDGLRLLWSLLKCSDLKVVASSADAICECVVEAEESADIVRSFVGGLELITSLLRSADRQVLISANRAIINIGLDRENLSIMTDYDVVPLLIRLSYTEDEDLKRWVAEAIATCSRLDKNVRSFSSAVVHLADSLKRSSRVEFKRAIACALQSLSRDPYNCSLIHQHEALKTLVTLTGSVDQRVQEAAAGCIKNLRINTMRRLAP